MPEKFQNKFRIPSVRLQKWDYGWNAAYFVTICTKDKHPYFGQISDEKMKSSMAGELATKYWNEISERFHYVELGASVVMPNHIHGIVIIDKREYDNPNPEIPDNDQSENGGVTGENNPMLSQNLSRIIRWYKGRVTFECRKIQPDFAWQTRFHDHIIRNHQSYQKISTYISTNPQRWDKDRYNK